jgi:hypothetical protein
MVLSKLEPMEGLLPLIGEAWDQRRRRWRRSALVAGLGILMLMVGGSLLWGNSGAGPVAPKPSGVRGLDHVASSAAVSEPASRVFRLMPYIGGVWGGRTRPGHRYGDARLSIVLKHPARSVLANFAGRTVLLGEFLLPKQIRPSLRQARALGLLRHAVFVGYFAPKGAFYVPARQISVRFTVVYMDGQRIVTRAKVRV